MKLLTNIVAIGAILGLLSTLICGLWMKQQTTLEASSISFHTTIGIGSIVLAVSALVLLMMRQ